MSGAWVFRGTRVPIAALFENLEDDVPLDEFLQWFPGVSAEQARAVLEHAARSAVEPVFQLTQPEIRVAGTGVTPGSYVEVSAPAASR